MMGQMRLNARVTPATLELVKAHEPLRLRAEQQADGRWMVGYGHYRFAREGVSVSETDAEALLRYDLSETANLLDELIKVPVTDHQFEALNAFAMHIGADNFRRSTVLRSINTQAFEQAAAAMGLWRGAGASARNPASDMLAQRRAAEQAHFRGRAVAEQQPVETPVPSAEPTSSEASSESPVDLSRPEPVHEIEAQPDPVIVPESAPEPAPQPVAEPVPEPAPVAAPEPVSLVDDSAEEIASVPPPWRPPPRPSRYQREAAPRRVLPSAEISASLEPSEPPQPQQAPVPGPVFVQPEGLDVPQAVDVPAAVIASDIPAEVPFPPDVAPQETVEESSPQADRGAWPPRSYRPVARDVVTRDVGISSGPVSGPSPVSSGITVEVPSAQPQQAPSRGRRSQITYALVGLLGVMLFAGALVSMFRQANVANLVAGLVGVAFMAPAAGHFLFAVLARGEGEGAGQGI
jgi:lysozyme